VNDKFVANIDLLIATTIVTNIGPLKTTVTMADIDLQYDH